ncbi:YadA-like family protein [Xenorhabdus nematophila]|uniref:YadA-like family protein n=1 Tax=Xenorhabdus nematophila TaxID=628 RepID=UPI0032B81586
MQLAQNTTENIDKLNTQVDSVANIADSAERKSKEVLKTVNLIDQKTIQAISTAVNAKVESEKALNAVSNVDTNATIAVNIANEAHKKSNDTLIIAEQIAKNSVKYTDIKHNKAINYTNLKIHQLESYTNQRFEQMDHKISQVEKRANAGIASIAAMANIPYSNELTFSAGLGVGQYRNGNAIAFGAQAKLNKNINVRSSTSWNNSDGAAFGAGFSIGW